MSTIFREQHTLATASRYANPRNAGDILPVIYGVNWSPRGAGRWTCPCIDTVNFYFLYSDSAVLSEALGNVVQVYVDGVLQTTGYTFYDAGTDENGDTIAYIDFTSDPGEGAVVTAQGSGKIDGAGLLMQHPLDIIADIVTAAGGSSADFDPAAWQREYAYATANHLYAAGILTHGSRLVQELVIEILASFLATSFLTPDDTLVIQFPRYDFPQTEVQAFIQEVKATTGEREAIVNATTWDITPTPNADILCLYPNTPAATVDCFPGIGATGTVVFLSDECCLSIVTGATNTIYGWYLNADRQSVTTATISGINSNVTARNFTQLPNNSRKRLFSFRSDTYQAQIRTLDSSFAYVSTVTLANSGFDAYGYWHDGTTGRIVWCDASGNYELWTIDSNDAYVSKTTGTVSGWTAFSYTRTLGARRRLAWRNNTTGSIAIWRLNSSDGYVSAVSLAAITGYTPQQYWHNGIFGRITYAKDGGGASIYRYVDANDAMTEWLPPAEQTDANYAQNSQSKYGEQLRQFSGGWIQDVTTPIPIQRALYAQYGDVPWIVTIETAQQDVFQLERGDLGCWSWNRLRDENSLALVNQIGRILEITRQPIGNLCRLKIMGTRAYYQSGSVRDRNRY